MFEVGQQVVCIRPPIDPRTNPTVVGGVYTIERVWWNPNDGGSVAFDLKGVFNGRPASTWWGHAASRFRPVAKRSDTLSIESFLVIKPGFEEPRRVVEPVKKREGV